MNNEKAIYSDSANIYPAISVVIPVYNAEKYIGECFESILAQTFQNFEVIAVDDCSTDNSCAIVENYKPKFSGKLKLVRLQKNCGGAGIPRNFGLRCSRGKYVWFIDSDDLITKNSMEKLYNLAEKYQADVVHCETFFNFKDGEDWRNEKNLTVSDFQKCEFVKEPTFETNDLIQRINDFKNQKYSWSVWSKLIRRDFLTENGIEYPRVAPTEDLLFSLFMICTAQRYLRVPDIVNLYRSRSDSISNSHYKSNLDKNFKDLVSEMADGFLSAEKFFNERKIFIDNPQVKFLAEDIWVQYHLRGMTTLWDTDVPPARWLELIREVFDNFKDASILHAFLFSTLNIYRTKNIKLQFQVNNLQQEINKLRGV